MSLSERLDHYGQLCSELDRQKGRRGTETSRPFSAATQDEIDAFCARAGTQLSPSYVEFLLRANGWRRFWGALWLSGIDGDGYDYVQAQLTNWKKQMDLGSPEHQDIELDGARYLLIGADDNGGFLALGNPGAEGERPVLDIPSGYVQNEWPNFRAFVEDQMTYRQEELDELARRATLAATEPKPTKKSPPKGAKAKTKPKTKAKVTAKKKR